MLKFPNAIEGTIETFRSALRAERLKFPKEIEGKIEMFRCAELGVQGDFRVQIINSRWDVEPRN